MKSQTRIALHEAYFLGSEAKAALPDILTTLQMTRRCGIKCVLTAAVSVLK